MPICLAKNWNRRLMTMKIIIWVAALVAVIAGCASQQDIITLDQRVESIKGRDTVLEAQVEQLKARLAAYEKTGDENVQTLRNQAAAFYAELEKLNDQIQLLNGKLEESEYKLNDKMSDVENQLQTRKEKITAMESDAAIRSDRIVRLEQYLGFESSEKPAVSINQGENKNTEGLSDSALYASAKQAFDRKDYETARAGFQQLLKQYPTSANADNAQFWIGEIYYHDKWYEKAILEYQKVIESYPKGNKVPAALLKQGLAFYQLKDKANCRLILQELVKRFPKSPEADIAEKKLKEL